MKSMHEFDYSHLINRFEERKLTVTEVQNETVALDPDGKGLSSMCIRRILVDKTNGPSIKALLYLSAILDYSPATAFKKSK
jgi:hypothetical protein